MILSDIRQYLQQRGQATLADMALHFDADPEALRGMLEVWIRKGKVHKRMTSAACGDSCTLCDPATMELYIWSNNAPQPVPITPRPGTRPLCKSVKFGQRVALGESDKAGG
jgi:hypothetical protein